MTTDCERYLEDPEAHAAHPETCADCRAFADAVSGELDTPLEIEPRPLRLEELPMAGWEGARHRTWPLVIAGALSVLVLAMVLFLAAGISPARGIARAVASEFPSVELLMNVSRLASGTLHNAPVTWHIVIAISFVVINTVLFLLLRRSPKGIDV
ncbi:MAG TPA: hypothetical protein VGF48_00175 [Thermoanaerobaculia bacterium]|jgi:hypothetical protein